MTRNQEEGLKHLDIIKVLISKIRSQKMEIEALKYQAQGDGAIRYDKERVQTSPQNYMEIAMADAIDIEYEIEEEEAQLDSLKTEAYSLIRKMDIEDERTFIINYYINDIHMNDLINTMHRSERALYYLRENALEHYGEQLLNVCSPIQFNAEE